MAREAQAAMASLRSAAAGVTTSGRTTQSPGHTAQSPRRTAQSPRRSSVTAPHSTRNGASASVAAMVTERRGSDGSLLRSVQRKRVTTISALSGLSVTGAAVAAVMFASAGGGDQVVPDVSAGAEPRQITAESVDAEIPAADDKSSVEVGAPSAKEQNVNAAGRSIAKSALPGCAADQDFGSGASNGQLPSEWLCDLGQGGHRLRADAAVAFAEMNAAYKKETGKDIPITDSYRDLDGQISVAARKPGLSARPGTSMHGWGIALDFGGGTESKSGPWNWLVENAGKYGWENPDWAKSSKYEPWHWEYVPARDQIKG